MSFHSFFRGPGKRRKARTPRFAMMRTATASLTPQTVRQNVQETATPVIPPRPTWPPRPVTPPPVPVHEAETAEMPDLYTVERMVMDRLARGGILAQSPRVPFPSSLLPTRQAPAPTVTGRVMVRSADPELDRLLVSGHARVAKRLVRPTRPVDYAAAPGAVQGVSLRVRVPGPAPARKAVMAAPERLALVPAPRTPDAVPGDGVSTPADLTATLPGVPMEDTQDLYTGQVWDKLFEACPVHLCRGCGEMNPGQMRSNLWTCHNCGTSGVY